MSTTRAMACGRRMGRRLRISAITPPNRNITTQLFAVATRGEAQPRQLTHYEGANGGPPQWSPDGKSIAFLRGGPIQYWQYQENRLAVVAADGSGHAKVVAAKLDRPVSDPQWTS